MSAVAACLVLAAVVIGWPGTGGRRRLRVVIPSGAATSGRPSGTRRARRGARWRSDLSGATVRRLARGRAGQLLAVLAGVVLVAALGGVVAGAVAAVYGVLALRALASRAAQRTRATQRRELLDGLTAAAADLRAGLPAGAALAGASGHPAPARAGAPPVTPQNGGTASDNGPGDGGAQLLRYRVRAAAELAERTGAPLAEVLDRIEADARAGNRAREGAIAQAAGARATAWLLAGLPVGGLGLGYAIGADPLEVLLHTPIGAACAFGAVALQVGGLAWTRRLMRAGGALR